MKKQHEHKIDELFSRAFEDYKVEPSEQIWENIKTQIPKASKIVGPKNSLSFNKFTYFIFSAAFIAIIFSVVYFLPLFNSEPAKKITQLNSYTDDHNKINPPADGSNNEVYFSKNSKNNNGNKNNLSKENNSNQNSSNINKTVDHSQNIPQKNTQLESIPVSKTIINNISNKPDQIEENIAKSENINPAEKQKTENIISNAVDNKQITNNGDYTVKTDEINIQHTKTDQIVYKPENISKIEGLKIKYIPIYDTRTINTVYASAYQQQNNLLHFRPRIYFGIHYTPEWIYNLPETDSVAKPKKNNFSQSAQISVNYDYKNIIIQSGVGFSFYNNESSSSMHYISHDSVGYYNDVTYFYWDSIQQVTVLNTTPVNVYDSVHHSSYQFAKNNYRYIQIPFMIGYRKYLNNRFSISVRGGAGLGILSYKKEPVIPFNISNALLESEEKYTPALTKTYWQVLFSVGCSYQLNDIISVAVEPTFKYYLSPLYEQKNIKKYPYSLGVKTGIYLHF